MAPRSTSNQRKPATSADQRRGPKSPSKVRFLIYKVILVVTSLAVTLLICEAGYRLKLRLDLNRLMENATFRVSSNSIFEFDYEFGYRLIPNSAVFRGLIKEGYPHKYETIRVNGRGNIGTDADSWSSRDFKILTFGNSFTANPHMGIAWPNYLPRYLESFVDSNVELINFGRPGYGALQIFHMARMMTERYKPDLIIVTMIIADLTAGTFLAKRWG